MKSIGILAKWTPTKNRTNRQKQVIFSKKRPLSKHRITCSLRADVRQGPSPVAPAALPADLPPEKGPFLARDPASAAPQSSDKKPCFLKFGPFRVLFLRCLNILRNRPSCIFFHSPGTGKIAATTSPGSFLRQLR